MKSLRRFSLGVILLSIMAPVFASMGSDDRGADIQDTSKDIASRHYLMHQNSNLPFPLGNVSTGSWSQISFTHEDVSTGSRSQVINASQVRNYSIIPRASFLPRTSSDPNTSLRMPNLYYIQDVSRTNSLSSRIFHLFILHSPKIKPNYINFPEYDSNFNKIQSDRILFSSSFSNTTTSRDENLLVVVLISSTSSDEHLQDAVDTLLRLILSEFLKQWYTFSHNTLIPTLPTGPPLSVFIHTDISEARLCTMAAFAYTRVLLCHLDRQYKELASLLIRRFMPRRFAPPGNDDSTARSPHGTSGLKLRC